MTAKRGTSLKRLKDIINLCKENAIRSIEVDGIVLHFDTVLPKVEDKELPKEDPFIVDDTGKSKPENPTFDRDWIDAW